MGQETWIMGLVAFTLIAALAVGFYQLWSVEDAKKKGSQSTFAKRPDVKGSTPKP